MKTTTTVPHLKASSKSASGRLWRMIKNLVSAAKIISSKRQTNHQRDLACLVTERANHGRLLHPSPRNHGFDATRGHQVQPKGLIPGNREMIPGNWETIPGNHS